MITKQLNIPIAYKDVLRTIHSLGLPAVIAGGGVRDLYFNNPIKDVDVFVADPATFRGSQIKSAEELIATLQKKYQSQYAETPSNSLFANDSCASSAPRKSFPTEEVTGNPNIKESYQLYIDGLYFEVIPTAIDPETYVKTSFDTGICMCYYDGVRIRYTKPFLDDVRERRITVLGKNLNVKRFEYTMKSHIPRIAFKFPNHAITLDDEAKIIAKQCGYFT